VEVTAQKVTTITSTDDATKVATVGPTVEITLVAVVRDTNYYNKKYCSWECLCSLTTTAKHYLHYRNMTIKIITLTIFNEKLFVIIVRQPRDGGDYATTHRQGKTIFLGFLICF